MYAVSMCFPKANGTIAVPGIRVFSVWRNEFKNRWFLGETLLTFLFIGSVFHLSAATMNVIELRKGVVLPDPILSSFHPFNLTWPIFILLWGTVILTLVHLSFHPRSFVLALQAMGILLILRTIALGLMPLEPMKSIIPLQDPIVIRLGTGRLIIKDLFFSGHTATMFMCGLASRRASWRVFCFVGTFAVALGVVLQHVHYSADVYAAPFFAYGSWRIAVVARHWLGSFVKGHKNAEAEIRSPAS